MGVMKEGQTMFYYYYSIIIGYLYRNSHKSRRKA